jgi:hypothetical protein
MHRLVAAVLAPPTDKLAVQIRTATFTQERDITKARQRLLDRAP